MQFESQEEELEYYRSLIQANKEPQKPRTLSDKFAYYLGLFCAYGCIVLLLWLSWNYALVALWPNIPQISPLQMAGLWYLTSVLLKRD